MTLSRLTLYDTTLRDGQQAQGVDFSAGDKARIAQALDALGIDYVEGGWPGANPTDSAFFAAPPRLARARLTAFGMTKRAGRSAANDETLAGVMNAGTASVCLVGKTHDFHVTAALGITLEENVANIAASVAHVAASREALFDAEHFFDGYKANPDYTLACLNAALEGGARWLVLCDTNGGTLPAEVGRIVAEVIASGIPGERLGIHAHDDTGNAVAISLAAVDAGARQIQGTLNGIGERCGNANLVSLIPTLLLKEPYASRFETGIARDDLPKLMGLSRMLDDILNRVPSRSAPYVGSSAFTHKAGLHASAILKDPTTYEHVAPETVGNARYIPMSAQAGQSNLRSRLAKAGIDVRADDPRLAAILTEVKAREDRGFSYDTAGASFEILARELLGEMPRFFDVERYRVTVERRMGPRGEPVTVSEAVVVARFGTERVMSVSESQDPITHADQGPVNALSRALGKDLGPYQPYIDDMRLVDFRVRITSGGTEAVTRVLIDSEDGDGHRWSTVGVSANIVDASFQALRDAILWKLMRDGAPVAGAAVRPAAPARA
ncbi:citramalate synthase [Amaricoccus solimangrovi]|uniref:Citramalate synthase n=1 Tax=Amaricoccus solimangrovi TaxID=2589815 RepID=A0A501X048_9RHOB|nr:citramalate synthase [Amaricoccus solimangrovi]TPE53587.1 citramalate synthase [Amaricoccus solimangrovi]